MKIIGSVVSGILGFVMFWTHPAFASQSLVNFNLLQNVAVEREAGALLIQLKFKKKPGHYQGPKFFKKSIQIDFPLAYVNPSKRYFETGDDRIRQVYVSQFDPKRLRLRLMLAPGVSIHKDEITVEQFGRVLRIRINSDASGVTSSRNGISDSLGSLLVRASRIQQSKTIQTKTSSGQLPKPKLSGKKQTVSTNQKVVSAVSAQGEQRKDRSSLSQLLGKNLKNESSKKTNSTDFLDSKINKAGLLDFESNLSSEDSGLFSASIKMVSTLGLVLGLMFVVFHLFKKFGLKNSVFGGEAKPIKVLSTGFLAPRKSIALVEVAGDVLIVGISNDQISLLGNVQDPVKIEQIKTNLPANNRESKAREKAPSTESKAKESQSVEEGRPRVNKQGVDVYNKRLIQSGSTNPFNDYVKQFTNISESEASAAKGVASRIKKKLGEVPVFK